MSDSVSKKLGKIIQIDEEQIQQRKRPFNPIFTGEARHGIYSFNKEENLCRKIPISLIPRKGAASGSTTLNNGRKAV